MRILRCTVIVLCLNLAVDEVIYNPHWRVLIVFPIIIAALQTVSLLSLAD